MTPTHYLVCSICGHNIPGAPAELTAVPRRCPSCDSASWEMVEGPLFPFRRPEREAIYKKILFILQWCNENEQPCKQHPGCCPLAAHHCHDSACIPAALYDWIMSTSLRQEAAE